MGSIGVVVTNPVNHGLAPLIRLSLFGNAQQKCNSDVENVLVRFWRAPPIVPTAVLRAGHVEGNVGQEAMYAFDCTHGKLPAVREFPLCN